MKTHLMALAVAVAVTSLAIAALNGGMRDGAARARLANTEPERVVVTAERNDAQIAAAAMSFTF
jgi:hypothetical protein